MTHKTTIQTYTGKMIDPLQPDAAVVDIVDIAWSLAHTCRFRGHCLRYYSVAEHCLRGMAHAPEDMQLPFLLHDAAEAYLMDVPTPVKENVVFIVGQDQEPVTYKMLEERWQGVINEAFSVRIDMAFSCGAHDIDQRMLATERRDLMSNLSLVWKSLLGVQAYEGFINREPEHKYMPEPMALAFLQTYGRLTGDNTWRKRLHTEVGK